MASRYEDFWTRSSYAVVGHSAARPFPGITYAALKGIGKTVFAVDPSVAEIDGDVAYPDLRSLPAAVDAIVLEVPKDETAEWVRRAADAGIRDVWIHRNCDSPEAVAVAEERGLRALTGTCAVMYVKRGFTYHTLHKWIAKLAGKY